MSVPTHIGVILDGNRRFAKQLMKAPWMGHKWGLEKSREVLQWAGRDKIHNSLYALAGKHAHEAGTRAQFHTQAA